MFTYIYIYILCTGEAARQAAIDAMASADAARKAVEEAAAKEIEDNLRRAAENDKIRKYAP